MQIPQAKTSADVNQHNYTGISGAPVIYMLQIHPCIY